jgi:hypothetical protein
MIEVSWDNPEKNIMRFNYKGKWTWEELAAALSNGRRLWETEGDGPVGTIIDVTSSSMIPQNAFTAGRNMVKDTEFQHVSAVVGANAFIQHFHNVFNRIYGGKLQNRRLFFVATLEEARRIIAERLAEIDETAVN